MPMPSKKKNESQEKFIRRFMSSDRMQKEFPKQKQRYAVALKKWREGKNG